MKGAADSSSAGRSVAPPAAAGSATTATPSLKEGQQQVLRNFPAGTWIWVQDAATVWRRARVLDAGEGKEPSRVRLEPLAEAEHSTLDRNGAPLDNQTAQGDNDHVRELHADEPVFLCNVEILEPKDIPADTSAAQNQGQGQPHPLARLNDLTQLTHLHEPALLNALHKRFSFDQIYTFTGPILIAVNPFKSIPSLYDEQAMQTFLAASIPTAERIGEPLSPHVFSVGAAAYNTLCTRQKSQTILISGESGAGKTESTRFVMKLLAMAGSEDWSRRSQIEKQVLQSNPLLESLGNAKTLRNHNSSRFGKFIEMQFTLVPKLGQEVSAGRLVGARIHTYLLESVRVCQQMEGERNYHLFYQICSAASWAKENTGEAIYAFPQRIKAPEAVPCTFDFSKFESFDRFQYLTKSSCFQLKDIDDVEQFEFTVLAMQTIGITYEDQVNLFKVVGAVLNLGNILFAPLDEDTEASAVCETSLPSFKLVANFLSVAEEALQKALTTRTIKAQSEIYTKPLRPAEAEDARDALAKALYSSVFLRFVKGTNASIGYREDVDLFCGVLDIFGFECFSVNSLEQLCINYTNERLQQFFNTFIFKKEEELYLKERVGYSHLDFPDNQGCVDLMDMRLTGIFPMLDEECVIPRGNDKAFCNKVKEKHKGNERLGIIKTKPDWFVVHHFAGPVGYCVDGFVEKNKDQLSLDLQHVILGSSSSFVRQCFEEYPRCEAATSAAAGDGSGNAKENVVRRRPQNATVSSEFRQQLTSLMNSLGATDPHFIRCIKPNPHNVSDVFDRTTVTEQLRYGGVLQAVQVSRAGYPVRMSHCEAIADYQHLADLEFYTKTLRRQWAASRKDNQEETKRLATDLFAHLEQKLSLPKPTHTVASWAVGETLVFLKQDTYSILASARARQRVQSAVTIQRIWKGRLQRLYYLHMKAAATLIQACVRRHLARQRACRLRESRAVAIIQNMALCWLARARFLAVRGRNGSAIRIQAAWRGCRERRAYLKLKAAVLKAQCRWRLICAKRELKKRKREKYETASLLREQQRLLEENLVLKKQKSDARLQAEALTEERDRLLALVDSLKSQSVTVCEKGVMIEPEHTAVEATPPVMPRKAADIGKSAAISVNLAVESGVLCQQQGDCVSVVADTRSFGVEKLTSVQIAESSALATKPLSVGFPRKKSPLGTVCETKVAISGEPSHRNIDTPDVPVKQKADPSVPAKLDLVVLGLTQSHLCRKLMRDVRCQDASRLLHIGNLKSAGLRQGTFAASVGFYESSGTHDELSAILEDVEREKDVWKDWKTTVLVVYAPEDAATLDHAIKLCNAVDILKSRVVLCRLGKKNVSVNPRSIAALQCYPIVTAERLSSAIKRAFRILDVTASDATSSNKSLTRSSTEESALMSAGLPHTFSSIRKQWGEWQPAFSLQLNADTLFSRMYAYVFPDGADKTQNKADASWRGNSHEKPNILRPTVAGECHEVVDAEGCLQKVAVIPADQGSQAVTCLAFSSPPHHRCPFTWLGVGCADGSVLCYRVYDIGREEEEEETGGEDSEMLESPGQRVHYVKREEGYSPKNISLTKTKSIPLSGCKNRVDLCWRVKGHEKAVTDLLFSHNAQFLVTASADRSFRFWNLKQDEPPVVHFQDDAPCLSVAFFPCCPEHYVMSNADKMVRVVHWPSGKILLRLRPQSSITSLCFDESGLYCLGGSDDGTLYVFEANGNGLLDFGPSTQLLNTGITHVTFAPPAQGVGAPCIIVNGADLSITVAECIYKGSHYPRPVNFKVLYRFANGPALHSCYSWVGGGWVISAASDHQIYALSLCPTKDGPPQSLSWKAHQDPVTAVAVDDSCGILASGDQGGGLILWRWMLTDVSN